MEVDIHVGDDNAGVEKPLKNEKPLREPTERNQKESRVRLSISPFWANNEPFFIHPS